jgi:nicotinamide mononucleotide transporter
LIAYFQLLSGMEINTVLEIVSVIFGIIYLVLMVRENIWCWLFGILASAITVYLYVEVTLYLEAGLNFYYILAGVYGWIYWNTHRKKVGQENSFVPILTWKPNYHVLAVLICGAIGLLLGYVMDTYSDSERPYIDALITTFSFLATYLEAKKVLSTWYYWAILNAGSIFLNADRGLYFFAALSIFYTIMSIQGFKRWNASLQLQRAEIKNVPG